jgi:glutathione S-transferase
VSLFLYEHPFAMYCWKPLIALYERDVPFTAELVEADRSALAALWPPASIPVLVDDSVVLAESSIIVEHLDRHGDAPSLIPTDPDEALQARLWDRVADGYLTTPVQRIVGDALRPSDAKDPYGVSQAHATLDLAYATLDRQLDGRDPRRLAGRRRLHAGRLRRGARPALRRRPPSAGPRRAPRADRPTSTGY